MTQVFDKLGVRFEYPDEWQIDTEELQESSNAVTVNGPDGSFWSLQINPREVDPQEMADQALQVMREEYDDLESEPFSVTLEQVEIVGYNMNFYCLDLTNTAQVRVFRDEVASYVVFTQAEDRDFAETRAVFDAITQTLLASDAGSAEVE